MSERAQIRRRRHGVLVWRRLPRPPHRQWRDLRPRRHHGRPSDHAAAELCAGDQSAQPPFDHRARQRSRPLSRRTRHGPFAPRRPRRSNTRRSASTKVKVEYVGRAASRAPTTANCSRRCASTANRRNSTISPYSRRASPNSAKCRARRRSRSPAATWSAWRWPNRKARRKNRPRPCRRPGRSSTAVRPVPASERLALAELAAPAVPLPKNPPLPPQRPFDLGTIPGADTPIAVARR